ncbi:amidase domain-containing protein [Sporolactobacillus sp. CQH2019]|uniref:amidase domain-containing protein n=1 Tax=Sporolactobacillus sp. CQH2019 TaxID=3023512 RepID=UPI002367BB72|nr:amidase domain-containing protein [Sporolactobacillus sp. CQH2019]MDD9149385.1 amidase domain-containing protein [Sporolactobacillus sp. CQH2019]
MIEIDWEASFQAHVGKLCEWWVNRPADFDIVLNADERLRLQRRSLRLKSTNCEIEKAIGRTRVARIEEKREDQVVDYRLHMQWLIKQSGRFYLEERIEDRQAVLRGSSIVADGLRTPSLKKEEGTPASAPSASGKDPKAGHFRGSYNRLNAVRYAEVWWNRRNPAFPKIENDCTNFISQCLFAGGIQMNGQPIRNRGWWQQYSNWSFSWAVANNLRWYLSRSGNLIGAVETDKPDKLVPGDVICYDFEGDGRWNHNTLVTALAPSGQPLVSAHTYDARHRDWAYTDSPAWTDRIQYKFFHIRDGK